MGALFARIATLFSYHTCWLCCICIGHIWSHTVGITLCVGHHHSHHSSNRGHFTGPSLNIAELACIHIDWRCYRGSMSHPCLFWNMRSAVDFVQLCLRFVTHICVMESVGVHTTPVYAARVFVRCCLPRLSPHAVDPIWCQRNVVPDLCLLECAMLENISEVVDSNTGIEVHDKPSNTQLDAYEFISISLYIHTSHITATSSINTYHFHRNMSYVR